MLDTSRSDSHWTPSESEIASSPITDHHTTADTEQVQNPRAIPAEPLEGETVHADSGEAVHADSIAFMRANLTAYDLLSKAQEQDVALAMATATQAIMALIISSEQSERELLWLIDGAKNGGIKKRIFANETHYFALRREMDELMSVSSNHDILSQLATTETETEIETESAAAKHIENQEPQLCEAFSLIDWPGPLALALAKRYSVKCFSKSAAKSTLEQAIDAYLQNCKPKEQRPTPAPQTDINQSSNEYRTQLQHYASAYLSARDTLVNHNLKLVFHIAKRYAQRSETLPDLVQEGTFGLIRAAEKYRATSGCRFSTYAHQWIDSKIRKARVNIDKVIAISHDYNNDLLRLSLHQDKQSEGSFRPSLAKVSKETNISQKRLQTLALLKQTSISLDEAHAEGDNASLHTKLADVQSEFIHTILSEDTSEYINAMMDSVLTEREAYVINERFGRYGKDPQTLQSISHILGISRERVRQLESNALKKLTDWLNPEALL